MLPIVNLQQCYPGQFTYGIGMPGRQMYFCEDDFNSGESCLRDVAAVLVDNFANVQICYAGFALGAYQVVRLVNEPASVFDELMLCIRATYLVRHAKVWQQAAQAAAAPFGRCQCVSPRVPHSVPRRAGDLRKIA